MVNLAQNRDVQKIVAGIAMAILLIIAIVIFALTTMVTSAAGVLAGSEEQNSNHVIDQEVAATVVEGEGSEGVNPTELQQAREQASRLNVPWQVTLAAAREDDEFREEDFVDMLTELDPQLQLRDLTAGYTYTATSIAMVPPSDGSAGKVLQKDVREAYTEALKAGGLNGNGATTAYNQALEWATAGAEAAVCAERPGGEETEIDGEDWTSSQISNVKTVIGIAKAMFDGKDREKAAIIGIATARVESVFKIYANDGNVGPEDFNMAPFTTADYTKLAKSLNYPHDAVGSDHASVGLMQQQATFHWGAQGSSNWDTDPDGTIKRLMDPSFASAKFFEALDSIDGWQDMDPGAAAQAVQVSAFPDKYAAQIGLAEAFWKKYAADQKPLDVPLEDWDGPGDGSDAATNPGGCGGSRPGIEGDIVWPTGMTDDGDMVGGISSTFGERVLNGSYDFHGGVDFTGRGEGSNLYAAAAGTVVRSDEWSAACGQYVEVLHADDTRTGYLHLNTLGVDVGDEVDGGDFIGEMGGNQPGGCTFGAHLHMYTYPHEGYAGETFSEYGNTFMDPKEWFEERGLTSPKL